MTSKRRIVSITVLALFALALYPLMMSRTPQDSSTPEAPTPVETGVIEVDEKNSAADANSETGESSPTVSHEQDPGNLTGSRLVEIFGRVVDQARQPIEGVLITEERYFFNTRSDALGNYRLVLDLPRHRYPALHFLRHGFSGKRVKPDQSQLQQKPVFELDMALVANPQSVRQSGWVGNDAGVALEAVRVELTALESDHGDNFYLTVFTDANGNFSLEGIGAGQTHQLSVTPTPEYQGYQDDNFVVGSNPEPVSIVLNSLKLVDIDGMILNPESAPIPDFEFQVSSVTTGMHSRRIVSDASGFFSLRRFPLGEVSLTTRLASRGDEYFKISGLTLTDNEYSNLTLIVDKGSHYLSGWVNDGNGIAVAKALVTLTAEIKDGPIGYFSYRSQGTDDSGRFEFTEIGGGEHRLSVYANGFINHDMIHRFKTRSEHVELKLTRQ